MNTNKFPIKRIYISVISGEEILPGINASAVICVSGDIEINGAPIKKDEVGLIHPSLFDDKAYEAHSKTGGSILTIEFNNEFFLDNNKSLCYFPQFDFSPTADSAVYNLILDCAKEYFQNSRSPELENALAYLILDRLNTLIGKPTYGADLKVLRATDGAVHELFSQIFDYMHDNIFGSVTLSKTAFTFSRTPQYISKLFKQYTGSTFLEYFSQIQQFKQEAYNVYTDLSYPEIMDKFSDSSSSDYEEPFFEDEDEDTIGYAKDSEFYDFADDDIYDDEKTETDDLFLFGNPNNIDPSDFDKIISMLAPSEDSTKYISHSVDTYFSGLELFPVWNEVVNLGYASAFTSTDLNEQLLRAQKLIHFRYGRICRIFDLVTTYFSHDEPIYDFYPVFRIFDALIANDMLPFLELGNKVLKIHFTAEELLKPQIAQKSEDYFEEILVILPHFLRASINRYGYECVKNWKFELCSPNHEAPINTVEDFPLQKYIHYFCRIKSTINSIVPECQVGGPGFNNHDNPESFERLLREFSFAAVQPDFYTAYIFTVDNPLHISTLSADPNIFEKRIKPLTEAIGRVYPNRNLYITEFNSNLSSRTFLNDSAYQGAFIVKTVFTCIRMGVKGLGYYMLSDLPLRYSDTNDMLFGGWGLITDRGLPKPSFHALHMLSMLGDELLYLDDNCIITRSSPYSYRGLFFHYENIALQYRSGNIGRDELSKNSPNLFTHENTINYRIYLNSLPHGDYTVKYYTMSPYTANLLQSWMAFNYANPLTKDTLKIFEEMSELRSAIMCQRAGNSDPLLLGANLDGEEVMLITADLFNPLEDA